MQVIKGKKSGSVRANETSKPEQTKTVNELRADNCEKRLDIEIVQDNLLKWRHE